MVVTCLILCLNSLLAVSKTDYPVSRPFSGIDVAAFLSVLISAPSLGVYYFFVVDSVCL